MECPVCYEECSVTKLVCGHAMCRDCVTNWYQKGCNRDCPMCRKPIAFRGLSKLKRDWDEKNYEDKYTEVLGSCIDEICESAFEDGMDLFLPVILSDITKTFDILKEMGADPDEIDYLLMEEGLYMSKRALKYKWYDEPQQQQEPDWRPTHLLLV